MRNLLFWISGLFVGLLLTCCSYAAELPPSFDLSMVPVSQVVSLYYKEVSTGPYVVCDDVLKDGRMVSLRAGGKTLDGAGMRSVLAAYGYEAVDKGGVTVVCKRAEVSPVSAIAGDTLVYRARHRDTAYLVDLLSSMVVGTFANKRTGLAMAVGGGAAAAGGSAVPGSAGGPVASSPAVPSPGAIGSTLMSSQGDDFLVFSGSAGEVKKLRGLLEQLDVPVGEVLVKAYMYEVGNGSADASALQLVAGALGSALHVSVGADLASNLVRLRAGSVEAVASALATDSRFKVVSSPYVRLRSGKSARFVSGGTQSVLGAILTNSNGSVQQSYERVDSGTILEVSPVVRGDAVDVDLFQQVSNFTPSPGQPPTLNKRELRTSLSMVDGEVIVLAGLKSGRDDGGSSGLSFLPFALGKSSSSSSSELVLVLEMKRL